MAMVDSASFDASLKEWYSDEQVKMQAYDTNPTFAILAKKFGCGGSEVVQPVQYGIPSGRSRTFSKAQANKGTNKYAGFHLTYGDDFGTISITRKVMLQSAGAGRKAFFEARQREIDGMLLKITNSTARSIFRGTGGMIGQISAAYSSSTTFTLNDIEEITNFELGDVLNFSAGNGDTSTDVLITSGGSPVTATVTNVDRDAGTVTVSDSTGLSASRYVFIDGDFQLSTAGFSGWIPATAPTVGDSWFGVDRSADTRLSGTRVSATNVSISEAVRIGIARLGREGASPDLCVMNHAKYKDLQLEEGSRVQYTDVKASDLDIGFKAISFVGSGGKKPVAVIADHNCQDDLVWLLSKDTWAIHCLNKNLPDMVDDDGQTMLREVSAAGYEIRADAYYNLMCNDPRANARITVESD